jgi:dCTP deaminase
VEDNASLIAATKRRFVLENARIWRRLPTMTVLSDSEISKRIKAGQLIPNGDLALAKECSYSFVPGVAFRAGSKDKPTEFPGDDGKAEVIVQPGEMIWIRTRDRVILPKELAGFWWQTNTLSRKGLMLVNMSMVEPGYEGDLACLFVNFGKGDIPITAKTVIAKMVFTELSGVVEHPFDFRKPREEYDGALRELALAQPKSFLQVAELSTDLADARNRALDEIKRAGDNARGNAESEFEAVKEEKLKELGGDIPGVVRKSFWWAAGALALLTAAVMGGDYIKGTFFPNVKDVAHSEAEAVLSERVAVNGTPDTEAIARLSKRLEEISNRLAAVEQGH